MLLQEREAWPSGTIEMPRQGDCRLSVSCQLILGVFPCEGLHHHRSASGDLQQFAKGCCAGAQAACKAGMSPTMCCGSKIGKTSVSCWFNMDPYPYISRDARPGQKATRSILIGKRLRTEVVGALLSCLLFGDSSGFCERDGWRAVSVKAFQLKYG